MGDLSIIELCIIGFIIFAKFAIIIGVAMWSKKNQEKKKRLFLEEEERRMAMRSRESQSV
ncbi:hypothetical protein [Flavobacterium sp.]|uniref:hypothetical protein n=1 Tax=Flavobacterium sp. TaxID=239 RepID=UPI0039E2BCCF